ncbi:SGNH hydrolase [Amycolatopsis mediterranei S699]|uniref:SGNH hydrolase n=4 Tax=Amycolatopsis mediterranei TaxID=33910 RepID=A0A0H3D2P9_AMYMU|nr:SGNH hydrolase [Amycolatopsis mediterranei U32]AEK41665.1 SGNH hydrolase [Amycolatopsis mediterranei S699]AGT83755.1 SGNH hydrolase [Amycolatopsis mediterranei RB]KDO07259.1 SGNH hydrolase [Amycolatopsis mediterranei]AFO76626.1 SGNH hydrolase [Amycolatopsis mediterranei S699]
MYPVMSAPLRFCVLGDSLAAGVGSTREDDTLGRRLARLLREAGHTVRLRNFGVPGARSDDLERQVGVALGEGVDLALIVIGANDLAGFVSPAVGARQLHDAVARLVRAGARVIVVPAPDLGIVARVPGPYRQLVSAASGHYAQAQAEAAIRAGGAVATAGPELAARFAADPALFSADRFHPSSAGYGVIAEGLAPHVLAAAAQLAA